VLANDVAPLRDAPDFGIRERLVSGTKEPEMALGILCPICVLQKPRLIFIDGEAPLDQPIGVFLLFGLEEMQPVGVKLRVVKVHGAQHPRGHHLPTLFVEIHPMFEPEARHDVQVFLIRERLGGNFGIVLVSRASVLKKPVFGIFRAVAPFQFVCYSKRVN
jgi:hypothetical protein